MKIKMKEFTEDTLQQITDETFFLQAANKLQKLQVRRQRQATKQVQIAKVKKGSK